MVSVKAANAPLPPKIHQLGLVSLGRSNSIVLMRSSSITLGTQASLAPPKHDIGPRLTPSTEITGMAKRKSR